MRKILIPLLAATALAVPSAAMAGGSHPYPTPTPPIVTPTPPAPAQPIVTPTPPAPAQPIATPPAFVPTPVTTEAQANAFATAFVLRNGASIAGVNQSNYRHTRRVSVSDVASACLQHPVVAARFGCIVRFNVTVRDNDRRGHYYSHARSASKGGGDDDGWDRRDQRRDRVRSLGCLAALRITGGPNVTPTATVAFSDCVLRPSTRH
jgi:hypothetical protein